jgi:hypothetical protein
MDTRQLYRQYYQGLRINYHRYCMIDEPGYSWFERLKALKQDEQCPIKRAVLTSWLARID